MALVLKDRVLETCTSPGTGTITLLGAVTGYQAFSTVGNGNTCYYAIADQNGANWEVGIGTYSSGTLARTTVLSSSNAGSLTNFSTGSQNVFLTYPSERSVNLSSAALTSGRVAYATTDGLLTDSANLLYSGTDLTVYGLTVGRGAGAAATNTAVGASALAANTSGIYNTAVGYEALKTNTDNSANTALGYRALSLQGAGVYQNTGVGAEALYTNSTGANNSAFGRSALFANTSGGNNTSLGTYALFANTTASNNTAVGYQAGYSNTTGSLTTVGYLAGYSNSTGTDNSSFGSFSLRYTDTGAGNSGYGAYSLTNNTTGSSNTAVGMQALQANTTASNNTAVGYQSLYANTTGSPNTAVGANTLSANTTGSYNIALSQYALASNTTGGGNIGIGYAALFSNTTASNNTAVGYQAGYSNTTGTDVTAFGQGALYTNTTGSGNSAFGRIALNLNTTGSNNIAMGYQALYSNTTGSNNVAIGWTTLLLNTTASNNTAVGYEAGYSNTTGYKNTIFGSTAGYTITTGFQNTCIGEYAGQAMTTGSNNTFLGQGAGYMITTGAKNVVVGSFYGNQGGLDIRTASNYIVLSDGDGNPRQVIDGTGNVGIGTSSPLSALDVRSANATIGNYQTIQAFTTNTATIDFGGGISLGGYYSSTTSLAQFGTISGRKENATDGNYAGYLQFGTNSQATGVREVMRLDSSGNLGLGTSSPSYKLHVRGADATATFVVGNTSEGTQLEVLTYQDDKVVLRSNDTSNVARTLAFETGTTERMRIDSSGDLLVGTTSSTTWNGGTTKRILAVANANSGDANSIISLKSNASSIDHGCIVEGFSTAVTAGSAALGSIGFVRESTSNTVLSSITTFFTNTGGTVSEKMRLTSNGNLKITPSGVSNSLLVGRNESNTNYGAISFNNNNLDGSRIGFTGGGTGDNTLYIDTPTSGIFVFRRSSTSAMTLDASGNLLVGTTTAGYANDNSIALLAPNGYGIVNHPSGASSGSSYFAFGYNAAPIGSISQSGTTAVLYNVTSDQRLKTNIVDASSGNIDNIKVRSFDWIADGSHQEYGMVAQELIEVAPYAVNKPENPDEMMAVDYSKLVPMMIKEIQDLKQRIKTLENK